MSVFYLIAVQQKKFLFLKERFQKQRQMRSRLLMKQDTLVMMMPKLTKVPVMTIILMPLLMMIPVEVILSVA